MGEKNDEVEALREHAKERSVILDRMGCDEGEAHGRSAISFLAVPSPSLQVNGEPSFAKRIQLESIERLSRIAALLFGGPRTAKVKFERMGQLVRGLRLRNPTVRPVLDELLKAAAWENDRRDAHALRLDRYETIRLFPLGGTNVNMALPHQIWHILHPTQKMHTKAELPIACHTLPKRACPIVA